MDGALWMNSDDVWSGDEVTVDVADELEEARRGFSHNK